jgi:glycosyltransferase involved in cell wall biosynthesis
MPTPLRISACVIAFNEAEKIRRCLQSLTVCDEILLVDSHSTDRTREIATALGARVIERDWPGYRSQKQFAVDQAMHDWILSLDADESLSPELASAIGEMKSNSVGTHVAFDLSRRTLFFGRYLRHGDWYPDRHVRLFDRRRARFGGYEIHEKVLVQGSVGRLSGDILHDSYRDLDDQLQRLARYAKLMGSAMHAAGKRASLLKLFFNPFWRFFRAYVLRLGCLDGWRGLAVALIEANYVRQKYLQLWVASRVQVRTSAGDGSL